MTFPNNSRKVEPIVSDFPPSDQNSSKTHRAKLSRDGGRKNPITALSAEKSLAPIRGLFAKLGNSDAFFRELAAYIQKLIGARWVLVHQQIDGETIILKATTPSADPPPDFAKMIEQTFATFSSGRENLQIDNQQHVVLTVPFRVQNDPPVVLSAALPPNRIAFSEPSFTILHLATQFLVQRDLFNDAAEKQTAFHEATLLVDLFSRTNHGETFQRSVFSLVSELEKFFHCDRVAIGTKNRRGGIHVDAVSGMTSGDNSRNLGTSQLAATMREAASVKKMIVWPRVPNLPDDVVVSASHDDLLHSFQAGEIVITPLFKTEPDPESDDPPETIGALALLWAKDAPAPEKPVFNLIRACRPHVSSLVQLLKKSKPGRFGSAVRKLTGGTLGRRIGLISGLALAIIVLLFPISYRIAADCQIQPTIRRTVAAPFENRLSRAYVKPGDEVKTGDALAELDGREIRVKLAEAIAARSSAIKKRDNAMVGGNAAEIQMAQLEADRLALEVERLEFKNDNLIIRSPIDGIVLTGNLERSEGVPVSTGQKLFEIAPEDSMIIEIFVPEVEIRHVAPGQSVKMRLESRSQFRWESEIARLHPVAEIQRAENIFIAEAPLENEDDILRPGMRGSVRIVTDKKSIGWILFHRAWEWMRLKLW